MAAATASILGITALDAYDAIQLSQRSDPSLEVTFRGPLKVHQTITINRPAEELYRFWRDFRNLPRVMSHLESVQANGDKRSHWKAKAPAGMTVEWDAEVTEDRPNQLIAWRSVGGHVDNGGSVRFVPARAAGARRSTSRCGSTRRAASSGTGSPNSSASPPSSRCTTTCATSSR